MRPLQPLCPPRDDGLKTKEYPDSEWHSLLILSLIPSSQTRLKVSRPISLSERPVGPWI